MRPDIRGVLTSRQGTGTRTPQRTQEAKSPLNRKVPRFRTGRLAFDGRDASLLPTPINICFIPWGKSFKILVRLRERFEEVPRNVKA
jgi:hypothetical protein